jgi:signal transduction histidine kinase
LLLFCSAACRYRGVSKSWEPRILCVLRIDDRLETALRNFGDATQDNAVGQWRQLLDILAQNPERFDEGAVASGLTRLFESAHLLSTEERAQAVASLTRGIHSAPLVVLLSHDEPAVAAQAMARAELNDDQWLAVIPKLEIRARGFLRMRSDLSAVAEQALAIFSVGDFLLPDLSRQSTSGYDHELVLTEEQPIEPVTQVGTPIDAVVKRIEQWRRDRENSESPRLPFAEEANAEAAAVINEIRFESDDAGTIIWVEGAPRGAIVGIDIARAAYDNGPGPDAYGASAFRQRMPMDSARMRLRGASSVEGDWRISAAPFFDAKSGRFRGYRGIMRRPTVAESAALTDNHSQQAQQLQQVIHELRTPLGAIAGFAEIIENQLFGPVSSEYRGLAAAIMADAEQLLAGFDDLSIAAKVDPKHYGSEAHVTECRWLTSRLKDRLQPISEQLKVSLSLTLAEPVRDYAVNPELAERIFSRLLAAVIIGCDQGEVLSGRFYTELGSQTWNRFQLDLPAQLAGKSEENLLNSSPVAATSKSGPPLLGLGFSLRLVRNLSRNHGGSLLIKNDSLLLTLPAAGDGGHISRDSWGD